MAAASDATGTHTPLRARRSIVSLALLMGLTGLWVLACLIELRIAGSWGSFDLHHGTAHVLWGTRNPPKGPSKLQLRPSFPRLFPDYHNYQAILNPANGTVLTPGWWFFRLPLWIPTAGVAAVMVVRGVQRSRQAKGHCASCGYDLRGLPNAEQCPECGTTSVRMRG